MSKPAQFRVVSIIPDYGVGGAERVAVDLLVALTGMGHDVVSVSLFPRRGTRLEAVLDDAGVPAIFLDKRLGPDPTIPGKISRCLRELKADVVHTHRYALGYALWGIIRNRPKVAVHTVHNVAEMEVPLLGRLLHGLAFRAGVHPVAIATEVQRSVVRVYHREPSAVIPNGIRLAEYQSTEAARHSWREQVGIPAGSIVVMCVARHSKQKNLGLLLEAFMAATAEGADARLVLIGDGPERRDLEAKAHSMDPDGRIMFLGVRNDVAQCLAGADMLALSSDWEGNPLSVMEAMAAGRPVVATAVGGVPELVEHGTTGFLVEPGEREGLSQALARLMSDESLRSELGARAAAVARARFGLPGTAASYAKLYQELAGAN